MKKSILITITAILVLCCALTACKKANLETCVADYQASISQATAVKYTYTVMDGEAVVYRYVKNTVINGDTEKITITESALDNSFALSDNTTYDTKPTDRATLCGVKLDVAHIDSYELAGNMLSCKVKADNVPKVLGLDTVPQADVVLNVEFNNKLVKLFSCNFSGQTGKDISFTVEFSYEGK